MGLDIQYLLRKPSGGHISGFTSGSRTFAIRSIAVYEDGAHAGQNVENSGVAPGTVVK
jgi:hypothetical protein